MMTVSHDMDFVTFAIQLLNAVQYGFLLFLVASGLTLIFGIMGVINLSHGSFYMIGAYLAWSLTDLSGNFWIAVICAFAISVILGLFLEKYLFSYLYRVDHLRQVLMTYGLILVIDSLRSLIWGDDVHGVEIPSIFNGTIQITETLSYPIYRIALSAICLLIALGLYILIGKTKLGMTIRAGSFDREMTQALGINITILYRLVFSFGIALAAFAGMIAAPVSSVFPGMGDQILIVSFIVVVIGGIGSLKGAMLAAMLIGLVDTFGKVVEVRVGTLSLLPELSGVSLYLLMAIVLIWRPQGIFGGK